MLTSQMSAAAAFVGIGHKALEIIKYFAFNLTFAARQIFISLRMLQKLLRASNSIAKLV